MAMLKHRGQVRNLYVCTHLCHACVGISLCGLVHDMAMFGHKAERVEVSVVPRGVLGVEGSCSFPLSKALEVSWGSLDSGLPEGREPERLASGEAVDPGAACPQSMCAHVPKASPTHAVGWLR